MPADTGCTPEQKKIKYKIVVVRAVVKIVVALMGFGGVALGVLSQMQSGETNSALKDTVLHIKVALPQVQTDVGELQDELKLLARTVMDLRERVSTLEGQLKGHTPHWLLGGRGRPAIEVATDKGLEKVLARGKPKALPTLEIQQISLE